MKLATIVAVIAALACAACSGGGGRESSPSDPGCPMPIPAGQEPYIRCTTVEVAEVHGQDNGVTLTLPVVVLESRGENRRPDPLLILNGGPGMPTLNGALQGFTIEVAAPLQRDRDLVFFDQRGTGLAQPSLDCPEFREANRREMARGAGFDESAILACRDRLLAEGMNLDAYNSVESAHDIVDILTALGYDTWNVYGWSYGSRLALTAARETPEHMRALVLDGTFPPEAIWASSNAFGEALTALLGDCARSAACAAASPDLDVQRFIAIRDGFDEAPTTISFPEPESDAAVSLLLNAGWFRQAVLSAMYDTRLIPMIPAAIVEAGAGDTARVETLAEEALLDFDAFASGQYFSIVCNEEALLDPDEGLYKRLCRQWTDHSPDPIEAQPVVSSLPALLLSGVYDPVTSMSDTQLAASSLSHSAVIVFPHGSHGALLNIPLMEGEPPPTHACAASIIAAFLHDPSLAPDAACVDEQPSPAFVRP